MSLITDNLLLSLDILLGSGKEIPATDLRAFQAQMIAAIAVLEARARGNTIHYSEGVPAAALGLEGDLGVNRATGDFYEFTGGAFVFLFNGVGKEGAFVPVAVNAYGTHPAFATQRALDVWLLQHGGAVAVTPPTSTAPAPPSVAFNVATRILSATHALGAAQLEYRHGSTSPAVAYAALSIDGAAHAAAEWQFRVKAAVGRSVSDWADSPAIAATAATPSLTAPVLNNLLPNSAAIGSNIQISGSKLTPTNFVKFGAINAVVVSATATSLTVTVPAGTTDSNVTVETPQGTSNGLFFSLPVAAGVVPVNLLFVGNSIVEGTSGGGQSSAKVRALCPTNWTITNRGHGGWGISLMTDNATAATRAAANNSQLAGFTADVEPYYNPNAGKNIIIIQEGSNEIINYEAKVKAYIAARRAEGWIVFLTSTAVRTDISTVWLNTTNAINAVIRAKSFPCEYGDAFVDFDRVPKISRYGDLDNLADPVHSSNNPAWNYDKVHWTQLVVDAAGQLEWDYLNNFVNRVGLPQDVTNYPTSAALPGEAAAWTGLVGATDDGVNFFPAGTNQAQFGSGGKTTRIIYQQPGFCGAFEAEQRSNQSGFFGFGAAGQATPGFGPILEGFLGNDIKSGGNITVGASLATTVGDTLRVELYSDKVIWKKNGSEVFRRNTPTTFPAQVYMSFTGGVYGGLKNSRIEGNFVDPGAPVVPVMDQGEAMALTNLTGNFAQDGAGVVTAVGAGQFGASANSAKKIAGGSGLRGFLQFKALNGQADGSFIGFAATDGGFTNMDKAFFLVAGGDMKAYQNGAETPIGNFAANSVFRIELYGPDAASTDLPNGGARYYKNSVQVLVQNSAVPFPVFADFALSGNSSISELRIGGPGLTA